MQHDPYTPAEKQAIRRHLDATRCFVSGLVHAHMARTVAVVSALGDVPGATVVGVNRRDEPQDGEI